MKEVVGPGTLTAEERAAATLLDCNWNGVLAWNWIADGYRGFHIPPAVELICFEARSRI